MAPAKRKRGDRQSIDSIEHRQSPHRMQNNNMAPYDIRDGPRRASRGGQGGQIGRGGRRNDARDNPNQLSVKGRATPTAGHISPPQRPSSVIQTPVHADNVLVIPRPENILFEYSFLTDERLTKWDYYGRESLIALGIQARRDEDTMDLGCIFQELIEATLDGRLDAEAAGNCVQEILAIENIARKGTPSHPQIFFLDIFSMICEADDGQRSSTLKALAVATGISTSVMRQELDGKVLQDLGLTRETFGRVGVRQATNLLYRQANYNLLREETEGYAKLVAELFTTSESERPSSEAVEDAFERVKALIGTFDLDVGRALDITLDVFASILIKHYRFFIKLLRVSSWWPRNSEIDNPSNYRQGGLPNWGLPTSAGFMPTEEDEQKSRMYKSKRDAAFWARARQIGLDAFFELSGTQIVSKETKEKILSEKANGKEFDPDQEWIATTGTFPPSGNYVAAQLLGFKLRFYTSDTRDKEDVLPPNLMYLTALLIKIGFISLKDLYPHLWPLDEAMPAVREAKRKELEEKERLNRPGGAMNALMMAGALPDDTLPTRNRETATSKVETTTSVIEDEEKEKLDEPTDQKVLLLVCLLTIGAIPEALFILGRFPWLPDAYPELIELINRILNYSIKDVYEACSPISLKKITCPAKMVPDIDQSGMPKGKLRLSPLPTRKQLRWPFPDKFDTNENLAYRFYWDEWTDNIPVCQSVDDIFTLCGTLLNISGVNIGKDAALLSKLARIGTKSLAEDQSSQNLDRWQDLLKRLLVPSLSLSKANTSLVNEIYDILRFYPLPVRFSIYAEWFEGQTSRLPAMKTAFARAKLETQSIMKRISLTNLTQMAKSLAKTGYASPGIVFSIALGQIEAYTNLTEVVVECAKYFTDLGYDVLVWSLLSSLGGKSRNRTNSEFALLPSRWLLALSSFAGKVYRRYGIMNLSPIIQYINDQLYKGNATDLVILKELISQMAGIVPDTDYTDAQLVAMTGGEALRRQTLISLHDKRFESTKTAKRLMRALADTNISGELLVAIAQHRQSAIYKIPDEEAHIKLLATMIDDTQSIMSQYLDLLRCNLSPEDFDKQVPGIPQLLTEFGLEPALAFMIGRESITHQISRIPFTKDNKNPENAAFSQEATINNSEKNVDTVNKENNPHKSKVLDGDVVMEDVKIDEVQEALAAASPLPEEVTLPTDKIQEILEPVMNSVKKILPEESFRGVAPEFYVTFWISTLSDFSIPSSSYENKVQELLNQVAEIGKDRSDMTRQGMARKEEMKKSLNIAREAVLKEFAKAIYSYPNKKARFLKPKKLWFTSSVKADEMSDFLLEKCIFPRLLLSPSDADYCFRLIKLLHDNGVPHFRTLSLYGRIFRANRLRSLIFSCTIREAEQLGRFLRLVIADLARWHADSSVYEKEAWGPNKNFPGFAKSLDADGKPKALLEHDGTPGFKHVCFGWQKALNTALRDCLDGVEWMHIRNAITILKTVVEVFPAVDFMGNSFIKQLELIAKREQKVREDLSLTSNATLVQLKKQSKRWVMVQAYGHNLAASTQTNGSGTKPSALSNINSYLNPNAAEFISKSRASSLSLTTPKTISEVEDGEVDDTKTSAHTRPNAQTPTAAEFRPPGTSVPATMETRKSEILDRREQIKRENAAKSSPQSSPSGSLRSEPTRTTNVERGSHLLPNRPDAPFPVRDLRDRHPSRHGDRRDTRDLRNQDPRSIERPTRLGDRTRDFSSERRNTESSSREFVRPDRERTRLEPSVNRWTESQRESGDRIGNPRAEAGRLSREMPPPRNMAAIQDRAAGNTSDRMQLNTERQELINPERAALISGENDNTRSNTPRRGREDTERASPGPKSPKRSISIPDTNFDQVWNDRSSRAPEAYNNSQRGRKEDNKPPLTGSQDRSGASERSPFTLSTNLPNFTLADHGRLNINTRQPIDPNFGRLNTTPPSPDIPSGPRDVWNLRGNRMSNTPQPRHDNRVPVENIRPPTPDRQPPTGPSGRQARRDGSTSQTDTSVASSIPLPTTPLALSPIPSIHPDRLKSLGTSIIQPNPAHQNTPVHTTPPIHPDRLRVLGESSQTLPSPSSQSRPQLPFTPNSGPPSGPKGSQTATSGPGSNGLAAPTGPASAIERAARGPRRQLAGINTMLQSNSDRPTIRGRGKITSGISGSENRFSSASVLNASDTPGSQQSKFESVTEVERVDLITGGATPSEDRGRDRSGRRERSGRHSRRGSRSTEREREAKRGIHDEDRGYRERSDRRFGERDSEREARHAARLFGEESIHNGRDRERERAGRRDGRERDPMRDQPQIPSSTVDRVRGSENSRSGRSREFRGGEDRRDSRSGRGEEGRKRHSEEGGIDPRKRIRRG
ncbi:THO complex subunit 2 [Golovinomyces cichoracearum]|uniref:THO complex subunit 2 n=1 Tax=Golovinomyces cichoracearum TaxID=62708 RepID=A0A420HDG8_9PEZI|nr:THO complex subunit 2 [Golovinomyces cichoracearum]